MFKCLRCHAKVEGHDVADHHCAIGEYGDLIRIHFSNNHAGVHLRNELVKEHIDAHLIRTYSGRIGVLPLNSKKMLGRCLKIHDIHAISKQDVSRLIDRTIESIEILQPGDRV